MDVSPRKTKKTPMAHPYEDIPPSGEVIEVAQGVFWLSMPLPFPGLDWINLWLIEGETGWTMVDTGMNDAGTQDIWESIFAKVLGGKPVNRVIVTHLHPDHVGLAGWACRKWNCDLWMTRLEYLTCRTMMADTGRQAPEAGINFYKRAGWDEDAINRYKERFGTFGQSISQLPDSFHRLADGDVLTIGGRGWKVITGAGHSPEHACLFCPDLNVLISGDQLLPGISSNVSVLPTEPEANPLQDWQDSCAKLIRSVPEDVLVLPAHNKPFYGAHGRLKALIDGHERQLERLSQRLEEPARVVDLFATLFFRNITLSNISSATGEALAHLNCLRHRGLVKRELVDSVYVYSQADSN